MIKIASTRIRQSDNYVAGATFVGACKGDPGTAAKPANEASGAVANTGGTYKRKATTWGTGAATNAGSPITLDVPEGVYTHMTLCRTETGDTQYDWAELVPQIEVPAGGGQITITPRYTQA